MGDVDADSNLDTITKGKKRSYVTRNTQKESNEKMVKYYQDPEKRAKLEERIKEYKETIITLQAKVEKLSGYLGAS